MTHILRTQKIVISLEHEDLEETKGLIAEIVFCPHPEAIGFWMCLTCASTEIAKSVWTLEEGQKMKDHAREHTVMARWYQKLIARNSGRLI